MSSLSWFRSSKSSSTVISGELVSWGSPAIRVWFVRGDSRDDCKVNLLNTTELALTVSSKCSVIVSSVRSSSKAVNLGPVWSGMYVDTFSAPEMLTGMI